MAEKRTSIGFLNGNMLKILAALLMLIDHIGAVLLPDQLILRVIGRLSFPIFAFMIAEGCRYTKNKLRHFLTISVLAVLFQAVYYLYSGALDMCILVTFSLSILMIYALQNLKNALFSPECPRKEKLFTGLLFLMTVGIVYLLNQYLDIDYGFFGCMVSVFASLFHPPARNTPELLQRLDHIPVHVCAMGIGLLLLAVDRGGVQVYSLFALPLLLLYSGERGKRHMKYFFYIFYPSHLVLLQGIYWLLK